MTNNVERCELYERESQNVKSRFACILPEEMRKKLKEERRNRRKTIPISKEKCEVIIVLTLKRFSFKLVHVQNFFFLGGGG